MAKKTLPAIKIEEQQKSNIESALNKLNKINLTPITLQQYRRMCYEFLTKMVLQENPDQIRKLLQK